VGGGRGGNSPTDVIKLLFPVRHEYIVEECERCDECCLCSCSSSTRLNAFTRSCLFNATAVQYRTSKNQHKLILSHSPCTTLQTPFSPVSFGTSLHLTELKCIFVALSVNSLNKTLIGLQSHTTQKLPS